MLQSIPFLDGCSKPAAVLQSKLLQPHWFKKEQCKNVIRGKRRCCGHAEGAGRIVIHNRLAQPTIKWQQQLQLPQFVASHGHAPSRLCRVTRAPSGEGFEQVQAPGMEVAVFWDYENCALGGGEDCALVVRRIKDLVRGYGWLRCLKVYFKPDGAHMRMGELLSCGVDVCPVLPGKEMADKAILTDALLFALDSARESLRYHHLHAASSSSSSNGSRQCVIVISSDAGFSPLLAKLSQRDVLTVVISKRHMRGGGTATDSSSSTSALQLSADVNLEWYEALRLARPAEDADGGASNALQTKAGSKPVTNGVALVSKTSRPALVPLHKLIPANAPGDMEAGDGESGSIDAKAAEPPWEAGCWICGEAGHVKSECPQLATSKSQVCSHCGKRGHSGEQCWLKAPHLKPQWASFATPEDCRGKKEGDEAGESEDGVEAQEKKAVLPEEVARGNARERVWQRAAPAEKKQF